MEKTTNSNKLNLSLDLRLVTVALLIIIAVMLAMWKPWQANIAANSRTVKVTGETTLKAEPDEYVFYPNWQFKNADKQAALNESNKKNTEVVAKLKELGVADNKIKTNTSGHNDMYYPAPEDSKETIYTLSLTVHINNKELAQKVQNYLDTTSPTGSVSPQATFSTAKRKQLEAQARNAATKDARAKAEQSAKNLGFKVGEVKEVADGQGFDVMPFARSTMELDSKAAASPTIQAGENEIHYTVTVTYFVK